MFSCHNSKPWFFSRTIFSMITATFNSEKNLLLSVFMFPRSLWIIGLQLYRTKKLFTFFFKSSNFMYIDLTIYDMKMCHNAIFHYHFWKNVSYCKIQCFKALHMEQYGSSWYNMLRLSLTCVTKPIRRGPIIAYRSLFYFLAEIVLPNKFLSEAIPANSSLLSACGSQETVNFPE